MTKEEKKAYILLKSIIFHYHGLDEGEKQDLERTAKQLDAGAELAWVNDFIAENYFNAFERARDELYHIINQFDKLKRVEYIKMVWEANKQKGYVTEMETTAIVKLAKDWEVHQELVDLVKTGKPD